jgi:hypothetical protein
MSSATWPTGLSRDWVTRHHRCIIIIGHGILGVARDTKRTRPATRGERPPSPTRRPAGASGSGFFGFGFKRSTTSQLSRTTCARAHSWSALQQAAHQTAVRRVPAPRPPPQPASRGAGCAHSPGQGRLQTPAASARPVAPRSPRSPPPPRVAPAHPRLPCNTPPPSPPPAPHVPAPSPGTARHHRVLCGVRERRLERREGFCPRQLPEHKRHLPASGAHASRACGGAQRRAGRHLAAQERGGRREYGRATGRSNSRGGRGGAPRGARARRGAAPARVRDTPPAPRPASGSPRSRAAAGAGAAPRRGGAHRLAALRLRAAPVADRKQRAVPAHKSSRARAPSAPAAGRGGVGLADALLEERRGLVKRLRGARVAGRVRSAREHFPERFQLQALAAAGEGRRGVDAPYPPRAQRTRCLKAVNTRPAGPAARHASRPRGWRAAAAAGAPRLRAAPSCAASGAQRAAGAYRSARLRAAAPPHRARRLARPPAGAPVPPRTSPPPVAPPGISAPPAAGLRPAADGTHSARGRGTRAP